MSILYKNSMPMNQMPMSFILHEEYSCSYSTWDVTVAPGSQEASHDAFWETEAWDPH